MLRTILRVLAAPLRLLIWVFEGPGERAVRRGDDDDPPMSPPPAPAV